MYDSLPSPLYITPRLVSVIAYGSHLNRMNSHNIGVLWPIWAHLRGSLLTDGKVSFVKKVRIDRAKKHSEITVNQTYFTVIRGKRGDISSVSFSSGRMCKIIIPIFIIIQTACRLQNKKQAVLCVSVLCLSDTEGFQSLFHFTLIALPFITEGQERFLR